MLEYHRSVDEIISILRFEPSMKSIYVEGISDYFLIYNYLKYHHITDVVVYQIDLVDFSNCYREMDREQIDFYKGNNKERVILLQSIIEKSISTIFLPLMCIVDRDWDYIIGNVRLGKYLYYTDYNSMDLYLFNKDVISRFFQQGLRISKASEEPNIHTMMVTLENVCRQIFHLHCLINGYNKTMVDNTKDFSFDKNTFSCDLNLESFWTKNMNKCSLQEHSAELRAIFNERISKPSNFRMEISGHDVVEYLWRCARKLNSSIEMSVEEFANVFWQYVDNEQLTQEPLFNRIRIL